MDSLLLLYFAGWNDARKIIHEPFEIMINDKGSEKPWTFLFIFIILREYKRTKKTQNFLGKWTKIEEIKSRRACERLKRCENNLLSFHARFRINNFSRPFKTVTITFLAYQKPTTKRHFNCLHIPKIDTGNFLSKATLSCGNWYVFGIEIGDQFLDMFREIFLWTTSRTVSFHFNFIDESSSPNFPIHMLDPFKPIISKLT